MSVIMELMRRCYTLRHVSVLFYRLCLTLDIKVHHYMKHVCRYIDHIITFLICLATVKWQSDFSICSYCESFTVCRTSETRTSYLPVSMWQWRHQVIQLMPVMQRWRPTKSRCLLHPDQLDVSQDFVVTHCLTSTVLHFRQQAPTQTYQKKLLPVRCYWRNLVYTAAQ